LDGRFGCCALILFLLEPQLLFPMLNQSLLLLLPVGIHLSRLLSRQFLLLRPRRRLVLGFSSR
jgi:hypothetical protein